MSAQGESERVLGVRWTGRGIEVDLLAEEATGVELCLFDEALGRGENARVELARAAGGRWRASIAGLEPGQLYGFRVDGPWQPAEGRRFDRAKLLTDPWARALTAGMRWDPAVLEHGADSAPFVPKAVVVDTAFDWGGDRPPETPLSRTVIYEAHVRGLTKRHPRVPEPLRGTYLGLASPPIVEHLLSLGVTAVELLPVQHFISEQALVARGLVNYWGYNPVAFTAPHSPYATGDRGQQVAEFKAMVKALHAAGIEVLLDVVYNHTAEGHELGPTLSLKGFDNAAYYHLRAEDRARYLDFTGCGNSVDMSRAPGRSLLLDSLRAWVEEFHVDGFRFDLAPVLGRDAQGGHSDEIWSALLADPVLARVKLIAEPWDLGPDGDRTGHMPPGIAQWNGRFRDSVRRFWRGDAGQIPELASRLAGSSDLFPGGPLASVNFVACHDGFTLADLVAFDSKRNEANGEENRDGTDANWSRDWGDDATRDRVARSLVATAVLAQGVTMLQAGDELGRSQGGNNNAYCQDNETSWIDWRLDERRAALLEFTRTALRLVREHPVLRRLSFFRGDVEAADGAGKDVVWLRPDGGEMGPGDWHGEQRALGMSMAGEHADDPHAGSEDGERRAESLLLLLNAGAEAIDCALPAGGWELLLDSSRAGPEAGRPALAGRAAVPPQSLLLLRSTILGPPAP